MSLSQGLKYPYLPIVRPISFGKEQVSSSTVVDEYILIAWQTLRRPTLVDCDNDDKFHDRATQFRSLQSPQCRKILSRQRTSIIKALNYGYIPLASFSYVAYNYIWVNGPLSAFTTPTYALRPVHDVAAVGETDETWEIQTRLYEALLNCESADIVDVSNPVDGFRLINNVEHTTEEHGYGLRA